MSVLKCFIDRVFGRYPNILVQFFGVFLVMFGMEYGGYIFVVDEFGSDSVVYFFGVGEDIFFDLF